MGINREGAVDVLFVAMPFCDEYMPCLTLALFKSVLSRAGIKSRVQHEYLYYASRIGLEKYRSIMQVCTIGYGHDYFACETVFAEAAHGKTISSFDDYIRWMKGKHLPGKVFAVRQREETLHSLALFQEAHAMAEACLEEACARIMAQRPKIVAFLSMFQQHNAMIALARRLKKEKDAPLILAGGANCEGDAGAALAEHIEAFDYVFTGEADEIIAPLCTRLLQDGTVPDSELPHGVVSRTRQKCAPARVTQNLDALPLPDFSDYFRERDMLLPRMKGHFIVTAEGSRGCWWAARHPCRFCGLNGSTAHLYRTKSTDRFADELAELASRYPGAQCYFTDNILSLTHQKELPSALLQREAYRNNGLRLFTEIKSNMTEEDAKHLAEAGFFWVQAGIESFSDGILRLMGKGATAIRQVQTLKHCNAHGINVLWYILTGTPGETEELCREVNAVLPKIMHLSAPNTVTHVMFHRYNDYMRHPDDSVPALRPDRGYDFVFPNEDFIRRAAHLFAPVDEAELARYYDYRQLGPAYETLYELSEAWNRTRQLLYMKDKGALVKILDTRLIARRPMYYLQGIEVEVLRACRNVMKEEKLMKALADHYEEARIREALSWLEQENLLLHIGPEYLALPIDRDAGKQKRLIVGRGV
ncbi:RiPP maturation radical SAM C-methyltransferase [Succiniclasticum ruminis]|uniref:Ribosomal peptide maturation radical SAM protein 1 n=1 Tax=Succiniclasticum ruminis DSM 9236 TaxID=1123323 RepID=A0A1I2B6K8_9FIRM|nr:RiPP maturation radical SAM C-methyltransferase [Succiniclasticum ruminis]SFE51781.1 ribosomal peptide maturation radical SAM protein 1 [Succiniclasticum ruminis DSM 9236]